MQLNRSNLSVCEIVGGLPDEHTVGTVFHKHSFQYYLACFFSFLEILPSDDLHRKNIGLLMEQKKLKIPQRFFWCFQGPKFCPFPN